MFHNEPHQIINTVSEENKVYWDEETQIMLLTQFIQRSGRTDEFTAWIYEQGRLDREEILTQKALDMEERSA